MKLILIFSIIFVLVNVNYGHHDHREREEHHGHHGHHGHNGHNSEREKDENKDEEADESDKNDSKKLTKKLLSVLKAMQNELEEVKEGLKSWKPPSLNESTVFDLPPSKNDVKLKQKYLEEVHYNICIDVPKSQLDELRKKQYSLLQEGFINHKEEYYKIIDLLKTKNEALIHEIEDCHRAVKSGNDPCDHNKLQSRVNNANHHVTIKTLRKVYEDFENHFFQSQDSELKVLTWEYWMKPILDCEKEAAELLTKQQ